MALNINYVLRSLYSYKILAESLRLPERETKKRFMLVLHTLGYSELDA